MQGFFIYLIKHQALKARGGVEIKIHTLLFSALGGGEWSAQPLYTGLPE